MDRILDVHLDVLGPIRSVQQGMELARANVAWNLKNYVEVTEWLKDQKVDETTVEYATTSTMAFTTIPATFPTTTAYTTAATTSESFL